jgi:hypothetical protein
MVFYNTSLYAIAVENDNFTRRLLSPGILQVAEIYPFAGIKDISRSV